MNQKVLDNLVPGEKAVDIQEYFYGTNGQYTAYDVVIYECVLKSILGLFNIRKIKKTEFPFHFSSKKHTEKFLEHYEEFKFNIVEKKYLYSIPSSYFLQTENALALEPTEIKDTKHTYFMVTAYGDNDKIEFKRLKPGGIWVGYVGIDEGEDEYEYCISKKNIIDYLDIYKIENAAKKEGTYGETVSYKLVKN